MSAPKHTPGPWRISEYNNGDIVGPSNGVSSVIVAKMPHWWPGASGHASQDLQAANAALIALAPDLLAERDALLAQVSQLRAAVNVAQNDCDTIAGEIVDDDMACPHTEQQAQLLAGVAMRLRAALAGGGK